MDKITDGAIALTPTATIVAMTKSFPEEENGARPVKYNQKIVPPAEESAAFEADEQAAKPDPAHGY